MKMEQSQLLIERLLKHAKQWQETVCVGLACISHAYWNGSAGALTLSWAPKHLSFNPCFSKKQFKNTTIYYNKNKKLKGQQTWKS